MEAILHSQSSVITEHAVFEGQYKNRLVQMTKQQLQYKTKYN